MLSMLCIVVPIWAVCKYNTPKWAVDSRISVAILSIWTLTKRLQRQLPQNDLQQD